MDKFGVFQCGKYHVDLVSSIQVFSEFFLVVIEYLIYFIMLLEEGGVGVGA